MVEIIPAILTNDINEIQEKVSALEGLVSRVQIDVCDGVLTNKKTVDPSLLGELNTDLRIDFHLMTKNPTDWVERATRGMADRIIGQIEMMDSQEEFIRKVQEVGISVGIALDIDTPIEKIEKDFLIDYDVILLMTYKIGEVGSPIDPRIYEKIKELKKLREDNGALFKICIDGGLTENNIRKIVELEVDEVAIGRRIFDGDTRQNIETIREAIS